MDINREINDLVEYAIKKKLIDRRDKIYAVNSILSVLELDSYIAGEEVFSNRDLEDILENIGEWAVLNNRVENNSIDELDIFDTKVMSQLIKMPSEVEKEFFARYTESPLNATDYYYKFAQDTNYIRKKRIEKDIKWGYVTDYGKLDITINLSKPEKDPRAIAKARELQDIDYPMCLLCKENEGYAGRLNHPARGNHRIISINLANEEWFLQYSPYVYYNEHCIVFKGVHEPMKITKMTFRRLLEFVKIFPHYFIGSNADLPIVGGSIMSHDHFQGGNYRFAMAGAREENHTLLKDNIEACTLYWPMNVIRLKGKDINLLVEYAHDIFLKWKGYSDESAFLLSHTLNEDHNTITPICREVDGVLELDLVLRNNRTSIDKPFGIFHPREEYHHIKKENIGLIEVMGLAVLPGRLKTEMEMLKESLLSDNLEGIKGDENLIKHYKWAEMLLSRYKFSDENINDILNNEIAQVFLGVLKDAGVFKEDEAGRLAFAKCREHLFSDLVPINI